MWTIVLLIASNVFMTFAWYAHLKFTETALWRVILASWGIAFFEYCLQVPANRMGAQSGFTGYQLKLMQEVITLAVFVIFAMFYLKEPPKWNYIVSFALVIGAVYFAFLPSK
jgi:uncharacterized protein